MKQDDMSSKLQEILNNVCESIDYSMNSILSIGDDLQERLRELKKYRDRVQSELAEVITASDKISKAYVKTKQDLVIAAAEQNEAKQKKAYEEAMNYMKLRGNFEEREKNLKARRNELDMEKVRIERILEKTKEMAAKFRMVMEVVTGAHGELQISDTEKDRKFMAMALQFAENEASMMARDVHDGPAQNCAGAILMLDLIIRNIELGKINAAKQDASHLRENLSDAMLDFRALLQRLKPAGLEANLDITIRRVAKILSERHKISINVAIQEGLCDKLGYISKVNIFRIIQEALSNAIYHGKADKIKIAGSCGAENAVFKVTDNGTGFDVEQEKTRAAERGSFGITNMTERARFADGKIKITSHIGKGASVAVTLPLNLAKAAGR